MKHRVRAQVVRQRVRYRRLAVVAPAVYGHAGGLVQHQKIVVLKQDVQRHVHRLEPEALPRIAHLYGERVPGLHTVDGSDGAAVAQNAVRPPPQARKHPVRDAKISPQQAFHGAPRLLRRDGERQRPGRHSAASASS